jgi:positive regulator of sigma E activity
MMDDNRGEREALKNEQKEEYLEKERKLIEQEVEMGKQEVENEIFDDLLIYMGVGLILFAAIIYFSRNLKMDNTILTSLVLGITILILSLLWRYVFKRHFRKQEQKIEDIEGEIENL